MSNYLHFISLSIPTCLLLTTSVQFVLAACPLGFSVVLPSHNCIGNNCIGHTKLCDHFAIVEYNCFRCACFEGFILDINSKKCILNPPNPLVYFAYGRQINSVDLDGGNHFVVQKRKGKIIAMAGDISQNILYWIELRGYSKRKVRHNYGLWKLSRDTHRIKKLLSFAFHENTEMAVDWIENVMFLTDPIKNRIHLYNPRHTKNLKPIIEITNGNISSIACDPREKLLYFATIGKRPSINVIRYDRRSKQHDIFWKPSSSYNFIPKFMSIEYVHSSIILYNYATNSQLIIGQSRKLKRVDNKKSIEIGGLDAINEDEFIYSDIVNKDLHHQWFDSHAYLSIRQPPKNPKYAPGVLFVWHESKQPGLSYIVDDCKELCDHFCIVEFKIYKNKRNYKCGCQKGYRLLSDQKTCVDIDECLHGPSRKGDCSDICVNYEGSYTCLCHEGNTFLNDKKHCIKNNKCTPGHKCAYGCVRKNNTNECTCPVGLRLAPNGRNCTGCGYGQNGGCSHFCNITSTRGYECRCRKGYRLDTDKKSCKPIGPPPSIIYSTAERSLRKILLDGMLKDSEIISNVGIKLLEYDSDLNEIYYSTSTGIMKSDRNGENKRVFMTQPDISGFAVDSKFNKVFWIDHSTGSLHEMKKIGYDMYDNILLKDLKNPKLLCLDKMHSILYWTEYNQINFVKLSSILPGIMLQPQNLVNSTGQITSLFIDYKSGRLYWTNFTSISYIKLSSHRGEIIKLSKIPASARPRCAVTFLDYLFWSDSHTNTFYRADKDDGSEIVMYQLRSNITVDQIQIVHPLFKELQDDNPCHFSNGECDHICNYDESTSQKRCFCFAGYILNNDHRTCRKVQLKVMELRLERYIKRDCSEDNKRMCRQIDKYSECVSDSNDVTTMCVCPKDTKVENGKCIPKSLDKNECDKSYCFNRGTCTIFTIMGSNKKLHKNRVCQCDSDYNGRRCETRKSLDKFTMLDTEDVFYQLSLAVIALVVLSFIMLMLSIMLRGGNEYKEKSFCLRSRERKASQVDEQLYVGRKSTRPESLLVTANGAVGIKEKIFPHTISSGPPCNTFVASHV